MAFARQATDEVLVLKNVAYVGQDKKMSCWFACAEMLFLYRRPNADFREYLKSTEGGKVVLALYDKGISIETDEKSLEGNLENWSLLTQGLGMQQLRPLPQTLADLRGAIEQYGPLWCAGLFFQGCDSPTGHIISVVGAIKRKALGGMKEYVVFHDPAPLKFNGKEHDVKQFDGWFAKKLYNEHVTNGESPIMYLPESGLVQNRAPQTYSGLGVGRKESIR